MRDNVKHERRKSIKSGNSKSMTVVGGKSRSRRWRRRLADKSRTNYGSQLLLVPIGNKRFC